MRRRAVGRGPLAVGSALPGRASAVCLLAACFSFGALAEERATDVDVIEQTDETTVEKAVEKRDEDTAPKAAPFHLSARVEPDPVPFGERFYLVVEITRPTSMKLSLPDELPETAAAPRAGDVERKVEPILEEGAPEGAEPVSVKETLRVPYLALDLADLETPELVLTTGDGEPLEISSLPVNVKDEAPSAASPTMDPPAGGGIPLEEAPGPLVYGVFDPRPLTVLGSFAISLAALFAYSFVSKRRKLSLPAVSVAPVVVDKRPAHEIALSRLDALLAEGLLVRGEVTPFVARLMDEVLRSYLEDRYDVAAGRRTTRELAEELLRKSAPGLDVGLTRALLEQADLVKFARAEVAAEVAHEMAGRVRALIEATAERARNDEIEHEGEKKGARA